MDLGLDAEQLLLFKADLDRELAKGKTLQVAVMDTLKPIIARVIDVICFDGNGYTEEWKKEAERRGLDVEDSVPEMFRTFTSEGSVEMFTKTGVYSLKELEARNAVKWETYSKKIQIEASVYVRMAINHILPAAIEYKNSLLETVSKTKEVFGSLDSCKTEVDLTREISALIEDIKAQSDRLKGKANEAEALADEYEKASAYQKVAKACDELRKPLDRLEELVDNRLWPLPKYRELLFIS